jgi:hypothetical protein
VGEKKEGEGVVKVSERVSGGRDERRGRSGESESE